MNKKERKKEEKRWNNRRKRISRSTGMFSFFDKPPRYLMSAGASASMNMDSYRDCRRYGYHDEENGGFHSVGLSPGAQRRWNAKLNDCHCCHFYGH
ncbi:hypothetical protein ANTRET_LOCUS155 [Anthophora retusa]